MTLDVLYYRAYSLSKLTFVKLMCEYMTERVNRRDLILESATELFFHKGYNATSVREIADAAGVTEAAIYYHFKDGKRALLQEVIDCEMPNLISAIGQVDPTSSLREMLSKVLLNLAEQGRESIDRMRWFMVEFQNLSQEERAMIYEKHMIFHTHLAQSIKPFLTDATQADSLAWLIHFSTLGYGFLMWNMGLESAVSLPPEAYIRILIDTIACNQ